MPHQSFPNRPVRRAQLISPFGIGAMVNFPGGESLMPTIIDEWEEALNPCPADSGWKIRDERLEERLGVTHFRFPPDFRESDGGTAFAEVRVPCVRFPRWHYCHLCGDMQYLPMSEAKIRRCGGDKLEGRNCSAIPPTRRPRLVPVRFVAVCEAGHIEDFPFMEWAHWDGDAMKPITTNCRLRLRAGVSAASLAGIVIECVTCKCKRSMSNAFTFSKKAAGPLTAMNLRCQKGMPWAGIDLPEWRGLRALDHAACGKDLRVVQRGASNVYFPRVVSSLYLQKWAEAVDPLIIEILEDAHLWGELSTGTPEGAISLAACDGLIRYNKSFKGKVDPAALKRAADAKLQGRPAGNTPNREKLTEADYRQSEYKALREDQGDMGTDFFVRQQDISKYHQDVRGLFSSINLVPKLRETRALEGFSRINPSEGGRDPKLCPAKHNPAIDWLPATLVYGEGIFLELNASQLSTWESRYTAGRPEFTELFQRLNQRRTAQGLTARQLTPAFLLIHALAHALINQLSFDCGYGSASLRERIYFQNEPNKPPMHGLLIYTASGDSEGSMGGLVRQGKAGRLEVTLRRAIERATWCSNDPVCLESSGQGSENCNLAACHSCLLLPETSCEEGNRLLDRWTLIGTHANPSLGYFAELLR